MGRRRAWHVEDFVVWTLRAALVALATRGLFISPAETTRFVLEMTALFAFLTSLGFAFIPTRRPRTLRAAEAATLFAFTLHMMGHALGYYQRWDYYDKVLHTLNPLVIVLILYALSQATGWLWSWTRVTPIETAVYLFAMTVTIGTVWEIIEFSTDTLLGTHEQAGNADTMTDIIADACGALMGAILAGLASWLGYARGFGRVSERPIGGDSIAAAIRDREARAALRAHIIERARVVPAPVLKLAKDSARRITGEGRRG